VRHRFGAAAPWSLGLEEELFLVDAGSRQTVPAFSRLFGEGGERLKPELFECFVELTTPVVADAVEALTELRRLRAEVAERARSVGIAIHAAGAHALAHGRQPLVPAERYRRLRAQLGDRIYLQLVAGLHVHVSVPDPETCLRAFEAVVPSLPTLLSLSANSPLAEGEDTGRRSVRAERLLALPTGGPPPVLAGWDDWEAATRGDSTRRHWDAWPRPEYGTLEVRVMDMQTDVRRSAGFAAIVRALVVAGAGTEPSTYDRGLYARRRAKAAAGPSEPGEIAAFAERVEAVVDSEERALAEAVLAGRPEAERQLAVAASAGVAAVPADVVARTLAL
jgi:carboxylate-amine ligase